MTDHEIKILAVGIEKGLGLDPELMREMFEKGGVSHVASGIIPAEKLAEVSIFFSIPRERLDLLPARVVHVLSVLIDFLRVPGNPSRFVATFEEFVQRFEEIRGVVRIFEDKKGDEGGSSDFSV